MDRSTYNKHRVFAGIMLVLMLFAGADYYLELGVLGRHSEGFLILGIGTFVVYGAFFAPTREDMRRHGGNSSEEG